MSRPMFGRTLFVELRMSDLGEFRVRHDGVPELDVYSVCCVVSAQHYRDQPRHGVTVTLAGTTYPNGEHVTVPVTRKRGREAPAGMIPFAVLPSKVREAVERACSAADVLLDK